MAKKYTIQEVARMQGFTSQYVRSLIRKGQLKSTKEPIAEGSVVTRHVIDEAEINRFLNSTKRKTKRTDGRNKYVFYANPLEYEQVIAALNDANLHIIVEFLRTANKIKPPYGGNHDDV